MVEIIKSFHDILPLSNELREYLYANLQTRKIKRHHRLVQAGKVCDNIYFTEKGLFRVMVQDSQTDTCIWFLKEGDAIVSVASFFRRLPSESNIYAVEDGLLHFVSYDKLQYIYALFPIFKYLICELLMRNYVRAEEKCSLLAKDVDDRYNTMRRNNPDIIRRISGNMLASYLGVTPGTLSRLKKRNREIQKK